MEYITEDKYKRLKQRVEEADREASRAQGALDQYMERLESEFECTSLKQARELHEKLRKEAEELEEEFNKAMKDYEEKWTTND